MHRLQRDACCNRRQKERDGTFDGAERDGTHAAVPGQECRIRRSSDVRRFFRGKGSECPGKLLPLSQTNPIYTMEFEGTVYKILPVTKGTSARGEWQRQDVVFEMNEGSFARKIQRPLVHRHPRMASAAQAGDRGSPDARHAAHRRGTFLRFLARTGRRPAVLNGPSRKTPVFESSKTGVFLYTLL